VLPFCLSRSLQLLERLSIGKSNRSLIREHLQPAKLLFTDGFTAEDRQNSQRFAARNQRVAGKGMDARAADPIPIDDAFGCRGELLMQDGNSFGGDAAFQPVCSRMRRKCSWNPA
jgi:hypothetical protein